MKSPDLNYILNRMLNQSASPDSFAAAVRLIASAKATTEPVRSTPKTSTDKPDHKEQ
jgi:hypothetical protein